MRIGVDVSWMTGKYRGMGSFGRTLVEPIIDDIVPLSPRPSNFYDLDVVGSGSKFFPFWEQFDLPRLCNVNELDFLLCPYNTGPLMGVGKTKVISVVHDLIFMESWRDLPPSRSLYQNFGRVYRKTIVPKLCKRADILVTVSHHSKLKICERFDVPNKNIVVIPNSISADWFGTPLPLSEREPWIFTVAGAHANKNTARLIKAFACSTMSTDEPSCLIIAGIPVANQQYFKRIANKLNVLHNVIFLDYVSTDEMRFYHRNSRVFVFASLYEGFGIPLIEAMASGTPISCSNTSCFPEVTGGHASFFDPRNVEEMSASISKTWAGSQQTLDTALSAFDLSKRYMQPVVQHQIKNFWREVYQP